GYSVLEAGSAEDALELIAREPGAPDILLADVQLPKMSGPALAAELRKRQEALRVVFMSGSDDRKQLDKDEELIEKPFQLKELRERLAR
ncbi:MAG TPA: response regulator, partial [Polyangiaceae bacterium]|nr:response regulator [Polyangiaceae bacterium]